MNGILFPVLPVNPLVIPVKVQLVHSECNQEIFRLPLLFIRILILHAYTLHDLPTSRIVYIVRSGNIPDICLFQHIHHRPASL